MAGTWRGDRASEELLSVVVVVAAAVGAGGSCRVLLDGMGARAIVTPVARAPSMAAFVPTSASPIVVGRVGVDCNYIAVVSSFAFSRPTKENSILRMHQVVGVHEEAGAI
jgi:hypothetical protein